MSSDDTLVVPALAWMRGNVPDLEWPLNATLIAGGRSNLTYRVTSPSGESWILRRQPVGPRPPRAHDLGREYRILSALKRHRAVPVPTPLALDEDQSVIGATFYIMSDVAGHVLREPSDARALPEGLRSAAARKTVEALASVHCIDVDSTDLSNLGPRTGYVGRQLRQWLLQVEQTDDNEVFETLKQQQLNLIRVIPTSVDVTLVHGDYRFDNVVLDPSSGDIRAILDWEIATLGDPLADLALFLVSWDEAADDRPAFGLPGPTSISGFPTRQQALDWYSACRPVDLGVLNFYMAFGYWRLACVLHCVAHRYRTGTGGGAGAESLPSNVADHVRWLGQRGEAQLKRHLAKT